VPSLLARTLARFDESRPHTTRSLRPPLPDDFGRRALPARIAAIVGNLRSWQPLGTARSNLVLLIEGGDGRFVVKVADDPYRAWQLKYEHDVMRGLTEAGTDLPVAAPLAVAQQDGFTFLLQSCVDGSPGSDGRLTQPAMVTAAAGLLRAIHSQPLAALDHSEILDRQLRLARRNMRAGLLDPEEFAGCGSPASTLRLLCQERPAQGQVVLLHGDYRPKNILWLVNRASSIIDWGLAMPGDAHYDLAIMRWYVRDEDLWQRFAAGYGFPYDPGLLEYYDLLSKFLNV
jgi:aminoglycoside phosphotransferase